MTSLTVYVLGTPIPQGSKVANHHGHGVRDVNAHTLKAWRRDVDTALRDAVRYSDWLTLDGPAEVILSFFHPRLVAHYGTGRNAGRLKPTAPRWKATRPDIDKLTRAVLDALTTSRTLVDDGRVARLIVEDLWADAASGVRITVTPLEEITPQTAAAPGIAAAPGPDARKPGGSARPATPHHAEQGALL